MGIRCFPPSLVKAEFVLELNANDLLFTDIEDIVNVHTIQFVRER